MRRWCWIVATASKARRHHLNFRLWIHQRCRSIASTESGCSAGKGSSAFEHAVAVAWGRFHKTMPFRRPVAEGRKRQALRLCFGIDIVNPSALHQNVVLPINQIEKIVLFGFLARVGDGLSRQQDCDGCDQE